MLEPVEGIGLPVRPLLPWVEVGPLFFIFRGVWLEWNGYFVFKVLFV